MKLLLFPNRLMIIVRMKEIYAALSVAARVADLSDS